MCDFWLPDLCAHPADVLRLSRSDFSIRGSGGASERRDRRGCIYVFRWFTAVKRKSDFPTWKLRSSALNARPHFYFIISEPESESFICIRFRFFSSRRPSSLLRIDIKPVAVCSFGFSLLYVCVCVLMYRCEYSIQIVIIVLEWLRVKYFLFVVL